MKLPNRMVLGFSPNLSAINEDRSPFWTVYLDTSSLGRRVMVVCKTAGANPIQRHGSFGGHWAGSSREWARVWSRRRATLGTKPDCL